ncbi:TniQ family protein [Paenibacillus sp. MMS18-CY102]|uniref:TniQ family protein n=1 Tax=Paenibacillus sp. MMS18-CY102 TaxID=2682849 RepID=UPI0013660E81|nr:TniQ family protein [Paenibacillus sp. MMS18-CY102]MWC31378.1 hypothetical protein [Paenibacillus sp. MMS18-CY102]
MSRKILIPTPPKVNQTCNYCWSTDWIRDYESPWSIFEKFKYANLIKAKDLLALFGNEQVKKNKIISCSKRYSNLYYLSGFDKSLLQSGFGYDIFEENKQLYSKVISTLQGESHLYLREHLCFCIKCLHSGYHSMLHQFKLLQSCPFHNIPLTHNCPGCRRQIPYTLNDDFFSEPFRCKCGWYFLDSDIPFEKWTNVNFKICSRDVYTWLNLSEEQRSTLNKIILFEGILPDLYPDMLSNLLSVILDNDYAKNHVVIRSTKNVLRYGDYHKRYLELEAALDEDFSIPNDNSLSHFKNRIHDQIYWSTIESNKSIVSRLRNTILKDHLHCIKHFGHRDEPYCPFAYAYIFWRKTNENFKTYWGIDKGEHPKGAKRSHLPRIGLKHDENELQQIIRVWNNGKRIRKYKHLCGTNWIVNKIVAHLSINHFRNWIRFAEQEIRNKSIEEIYDKLQFVATYQPFKYENLPFFLVKLPNEEDEEKLLEFHFWTNSKQSIRYDQIYCPNQKRS